MTTLVRAGADDEAVESGTNEALLAVASRLFDV